MESLLELDKDILLLLNSLHTSWLDPVMFWLTKTIVWLPLYVFLLYLAIKDYKKQTWIILVGIGITILLADQITSGLMKPFFQRLRPSHEPTLEGLIHLVNGYKGGRFGFASGHAANTFGTATFFYLVFRYQHAWIKWIFLWAALMTYTRIYLGVHYPGDILVGGTIGCLVGWIGYNVFTFVEKKINTPLAD